MHLYIVFSTSWSSVTFKVFVIRTKVFRNYVTTSYSKKMYLEIQQLQPQKVKSKVCYGQELV